MENLDKENLEILDNRLEFRKAKETPDYLLKIIDKLKTNIKVYWDIDKDYKNLNDINTICNYIFNTKPEYVTTLCYDKDNLQLRYSDTIEKDLEISVDFWNDVKLKEVLLIDKLASYINNDLIKFNVNKIIIVRSRCFIVNDGEKSSLKMNVVYKIKI